MKRSLKSFFSSFYLTLVIIFCIGFAFYGVAKAYENMVYTSFGTKKTAFEITEDGIRFLDFVIKFQ